jgi:hypothetical protein
MLPRPLIYLVALMVVLTAVAIVILAAAPKTAEQRAAEAKTLREAIHLAPAVADVELIATGAVADFGIDNGVRLVRVRIVEHMAVRIEISATREVTLAEKARLCLVGPDSAPDDAGLEDRCWGQPDVSDLLVDYQGERSVLRPGEPIVLESVIRRGDVRCDYAPGEWVLQVKLNPLVDGIPAGAEYLPDTPFQVAIPQHGPLPYLKTDRTRYCGLATRIYHEQGEPEVMEP